MEKKRIYYLDVLRAFAFAMIVLYHFMVESEGIFSFVAHGAEYGNANAHMATLGVSLFFMLSGAGLMLSGKENFSVKEFYKKRFVRVLVPFYLVYAGMFFYRFYEIKRWPFTGEIPMSSFIYTLTGTDTYFSSMGIPTFTFVIGEWFLGCLVMMYVLFPLIRLAVKKTPWIFLGAATVYYILLVLFYPFSLEPHVNFFVKIYDFILGMYLVVFAKKLSAKSLLVTVPAAAMFFLLPVEIPLPEAYKITIFAAVMFLLASQLEGVFAKIPGIKKWLYLVQNYSFEFYLIHHIAINWFSDQFSGIGRELLDREIIVLFLLEMIVIFLLSWLLKQVEERMVSFFSRSL